MAVNDYLHALREQARDDKPAEKRTEKPRDEKRPTKERPTDAPEWLRIP